MSLEGHLLASLLRGLFAHLKDEAWGYCWPLPKACSDLAS